MLLKKKDAAQPSGRKIGLAAFFCAFFLGAAVWLLSTLVWEQRRWSDLKMEEIVGQLLTGMEGSSRGLVTEHIVYCILPGVLTTAVVLFVLCRMTPEKRAALTKRITALTSVCLTAVALYACLSLDIVGYAVSNMTDSTYIEDNYVDPAQVELTFPEKKRNLIYIWLESMESSYADTAHGGALEQNRIPELTELAEENVSFTGTAGGVNGGYSVTGATWTVGALFAQTSGLPLKIPLTNNAMSEQENFFPGITTLGDILRENGYRQSLLIGSDASFGGRRQYFSQHGDYTMWDYNYSQQTGQIPGDYYVWWGYEDEKLFEFAKQHLLELAESDEPFNFSMLTVDTHFADGYVCRLCQNTFSDPYSNVIACSSRQVGAFVEWIKQQPFYENTTIILAGDHVTMDVDCGELIGEDFARRTYETIINPAAEVEDPTAYRAYTVLDCFPTTLAALGVDIAGERLGLGVNLFSTGQTLLERDGLDKMNREFKRQSDFMEQHSGISDELYAIYHAFADLDTELDVQFGEDALTYTLYHVDQIENDFSQIEIYADLMYGDVKITQWSALLDKQPDGSYQAVMPIEAMQGIDSYVIHIYAMTSAGRIKVDGDYDCSIQNRTLTR